MTFLKWLTAPKRNVDFVTRLGYMPVTQTAFANELPNAVRTLDDPMYISLYQAYLDTQSGYTFYTPPQRRDYLELETRFEEQVRLQLTAGRVLCEQQGDGAREGLIWSTLDQFEKNLRPLRRQKGGDSHAPVTGNALGAGKSKDAGREHAAAARAVLVQHGAGDPGRRAAGREPDGGVFQHGAKVRPVADDPEAQHRLGACRADGPAHGAEHCPVGGAHARAGQAARRRRADVLRAQRRSRRDRGRRDGALSRAEHLFEIQRVQRRGLLSGRDGQHGAAGRGDLARGAVPALIRRCAPSVRRTSTSRAFAARRRRRAARRCRCTTAGIRS